MRNLIVRLFALDYMGKIGKQNFNFLRAANIIFPLSVLASVLVVSQEGIIPLIALIALAIGLFFGFIYFNFYPVKFSELDTSQKWQYGKQNFVELSADELAEWQAIDKEKESLIYTPTWVLLTNPIVFILLIIFMFI